MTAATTTTSTIKLTKKLKEDGSLASTTDTPVYTLYDLEKLVIDALNDFNEKYASYLRCSANLEYGANDLNYNLAYTDKVGCDGVSTDKAVNLTAAKLAYNTLATRIANLNNGIVNLQATGGMTKDEYQRKYDEMLSKHKEVLRIREEIDGKMKDIQAVDDVNKREDRPRVRDVFIHHDATVYSSMVLTVLATSLIYYAFVKM